MWQRLGQRRVLLALTVLSVGLALWAWMRPLHVIRMRQSGISLFSRSSDSTHRNFSKTVPEGKSLTMFVRGYAEPRHMKEFDALLESLYVFWPRGEYDLIVVLDDEDDRAHDWGKHLVQLPHVHVRYEPAHPTHYNNNGHVRQQWSMMWADNYTDSDYVAFVDTDTLFITVMTYELLFDEQARPRVAGQLGPPSDQHWANISANTELWFGKPEVVRGMFAFPVTMRRDTLPLMREAISKHHGGRHFNEVFERLTVADLFSQFNIMLSYVWHYHRDQYSWFYYVNRPDWTGPAEPGRIDMDTYYKIIDEHPSETDPVINPGLHTNYLPQKWRGRPCCGRLLLEGYCHAVDYEDKHMCPDPPGTKYRYYEALFVVDRMPHQIMSEYHPRCISASRQHYRNIVRSGYKFSEAQRILIQSAAQ